jgi:catalase (peroxidase I)
MNLLDMTTAWQATPEDEEVFEGRDCKSGEYR